MKQSEKKPLPFQGVGTALVTPFANGALDMPRFRALLARQIAAGIDALVVCGTTGEAATLKRREKAALLAEAVEQSAGAVPIVAGTGATDTQEAVFNARYAAAHGANALLIVTPYYNKGTKEGLVTHYLTIAEAVELPILLYNVPSRTGVNIPLPSLRRLAEHPNIVGIKEASGDLARLTDIAAEGERLALYSGNDSEFLPTLSLGGTGVISVLSNLLPKEVKEIYTHFKQKKNEEAAALSARLLPLCRLLFADTNPAPVKYAMALKGYILPDLRLPLTPPDANLAAALQAEVIKW